MNKHILIKALDAMNIDDSGIVHRFSPTSVLDVRSASGGGVLFATPIGNYYADMKDSDYHKTFLPTDGVTGGVL